MGSLSMHLIQDKISKILTDNTEVSDIQISTVTRPWNDSAFLDIKYDLRLNIGNNIFFNHVKDNCAKVNINILTKEYKVQYNSQRILWYLFNHIYNTYIGLAGTTYKRPKQTKKGRLLKKISGVYYNDYVSINNRRISIQKLAEQFWHMVLNDTVQLKNITAALNNSFV